MALIENRGGTQGLELQALTQKSREPTTRREIEQKVEFGKKLDLDAIREGLAEKPAFVLTQFPKAGEEVPSGTTIDLVMLPKDNVRVDDVAVDLRVKQAFPEQDITKVREEIEKDPRLQKVLDRDVEYDVLSPEDKLVFEEYVREKGIFSGDSDPVELKNLHGDIDVLYKF